MAVGGGTGYVGYIAEYSGEELFASYVERFEQFLSVNDVPDIKKVPLFLTMIGPKCYDVLRNSVAPDKPSTKAYEALKKVLLDYYTPEKCVIAERYRFHKRFQKAEETVTQFGVELKKLAQYCNFGTFLDDALRDQFVCGIMSEDTRRRLLVKPDLTYNSAVKEAVSMELASNQTKEFASEAVHSVAKGSTNNGPNYQKKQSITEQRSKRICFRCGGPWKPEHPSECKARNATCHACGIKGHFGNQCRKKSQHRVHQLQEEPPVKEEVPGDCNCSLCVSEVNTVEAINLVTPRLTKSLTVESKGIEFEVDTGAAVSIISKENFVKYFNNSVKIEKCNISLKAASSHFLNVVGQAWVKVTSDNCLNSISLPIVVIQGQLKTPLLGRDWLNALYPKWKINLLLINKINQECSITDILREKFPRVFSNELSSCINEFTAHIALQEGATPVFRKPYTIPYGIIGKVNTKIDELVENGLWTPVTSSDWASPLVVVPKKGSGADSIRLCVDYKSTVNKNVIRDRYPLPRLDDILNSLSGNTMFCTLDLSAAYTQVRLSEAGKEILTVNTHRGLFRVNRLPFGVSCAPGIFQSIMDTILKDIPSVCCYLDDVVVAGVDRQQCEQNLFKVLQKLEEFNVRVNLSKCSFFEKSVEYLGHIIDDQGIRPAAKMTAIVECPVPTNITQLKSYLGMLNFYGKFIPNLSLHLQPLYRLLRSDTKFVWGTCCERAFELSKKLLLHNNILTHYNPKIPIYVISDASPDGVGAVLCHIINGVEKPILFASATLSKAEQNYSQLDREALGLVFAVKHFHKYIYGRKFYLVTDNQPLNRILGSKTGIPPLAACRLQRWAVILSNYDYELIVRRDLKCADMLSRLPMNQSTGDEVLQIQVEEPLRSWNIARETAKDPVLSKVADLTKRGWPCHMSDENVKPYFNVRTELSVSNGCLCLGNRIVVPLKFRDRVLDLLHENHPGIVRMKLLARSYVFWPKINDEIEKKIKGCKVCQVTQNVTTAKNLVSWEFAQRVGQRAHIDFLDFHGQKILIYVDAYSKWVDAHVMQGTDSTKTLDKLLGTFSILGFPQELISDNGPPFNSIEFEQFCKENAIKLTHSPPYHPQSNGMAEKAVQSIKQNLKKSLLECKVNSSLINKVNRYLLYSRNTPCVKTGVAPAELILKHLPRTKLSILKPEFNCAHPKEIDCRMPTFIPEQSVFVKSVADKEVKWWPAKILERKSYATYLVLVNGRTRLYHASYIKINQTIDQARSEEAKAGLPLSEAYLGNTGNKEQGVNGEQNIDITFSGNNTSIADESSEPARTLTQISPKSVANKDSESPGPRRSQRVCHKPNRLNL